MVKASFTSPPYGHTVVRLKSYDRKKTFGTDGLGILKISQAHHGRFPIHRVNKQKSSPKAQASTWLERKWSQSRANVSPLSLQPLVISCAERMKSRTGLQSKSGCVQMCTICPWFFFKAFTLPEVLYLSHFSKRRRFQPLCWVRPLDYYLRLHSLGINYTTL